MPFSHIQPDLKAGESEVTQYGLRSVGICILGIATLATLHVLFNFVVPELIRCSHSRHKRAPSQIIEDMTHDYEALRISTDVNLNRLKAETETSNLQRHQPFWLLLGFSGIFIVLNLIVASIHTANRIGLEYEVREHGLQDNLVSLAGALFSGIWDTLLLAAQLTRLHAILQGPALTQPIAARLGRFACDGFPLKRWILPSLATAAVIIVSMEFVSPLFYHIALIGPRVSMLIGTISNLLLLVCIVAIDTFFVGVVVKAKRRLNRHVNCNRMLYYLFFDMFMVMIAIVVFGLLKVPDHQIAYSSAMYAKAFQGCFHFYVIIAVNHRVAVLLQDPVERGSVRLSSITSPVSASSRSTTPTSKIPSTPHPSRSNLAKMQPTREFKRPYMAGDF